MWVFIEQRKFSGSVNLEVLDVTLQRAGKFFKICELGGARCGLE